MVQNRVFDYDLKHEPETSESAYGVVDRLEQWEILRLKCVSLSILLIYKITKCKSTSVI